MRHFTGFVLLIIGIVGLCMPAIADGTPRRVITVGAPATEIVFALGAGDSVIATDSTSTRPDPVPTLPKVGYMRQLAAEGIIGLKPDLIVGVEKSGPDVVLNELSDLGIPIVILPSLAKMENLSDAIAMAGDALGRVDAAKLLSDRVQDDLAQLQGNDGADRPSIVFLMAVGHGKPLSAGHETTADEIITMIGGANSMAGFDGFKPVSPEVIASDASDYVLVTQSTIDQLGGIEGLQTHPVLGLNKAVANGRVLAISASTILGFGPSSAAEIRALADHLRKAEQGS
ncbi:heme/hemin ABC transporter substrate-binding protein [Thalassospira indica]|uniref:Hemin ABC transporter substrate-binding protein n=1 Tax=Thalassospira indica TaxID=1891279 RepID=A0ABM6XV44_9PROT|nr:ABC transporter substrate-binding protein [Thalassospira indica]AXO13219.1 hemin ABC transporter substrate-binding protein [Thalassospira indica]